MFITDFGEINVINAKLDIQKVFCYLQINANAMHNALSAETKPWVELGRCLGTLLANLQSNNNDLTVTASGEWLISLVNCP